MNNFPVQKKTKLGSSKHDILISQTLLLIVQFVKSQLITSNFRSFITISKHNFPHTTIITQLPLFKKLTSYEYDILISQTLLLFVQFVKSQLITSNFRSFYTIPKHNFAHIKS